MSTILQALKRLEKNRTAHTTESQHAVTFKTFDTGRVLHRAARFSWLRSKITARSLLILSLILAGIALHAFSGLSPVDQKPSPSSIQASDEVAPRPEKYAPPSLEEDLNATEDIPMQPLVRQSLPLARPGERSTNTERSSNTAARPSSPVTAPTATAPAPPPPESRQRSIDAERLTDGSLSIQAIAWSANPDERIAVINNRVTREGASIDGYSIITIAEEAVYVRKEGKLWMVRFGRP
jgi:hypothetical protein